MHIERILYDDAAQYCTPINSLFFIIWTMVRVLLELKHSYRTHMPLHPGPDTRILRISRLRVTYELPRSSRISRHFHCCCFGNTNGLWFVYKTKLTLKIKRKHLKDILR